MMDIPSYKIHDAKELGYDAQERLIEHLELKSSDRIPWSFTIKEIVVLLGNRRMEIIHSINWGHQKQQGSNEPPPRVQKRLDEILNVPHVIDDPIFQSIEPPQKRLSQYEGNELKKKQLGDFEFEFDFYSDALVLAKAREKNVELRKWLIDWVRDSVDRSTKNKLKGRRRFRVDRDKVTRTLNYLGTVASTTNEETTIKVEFKKTTQYPVKNGLKRRTGGQKYTDTYSKSALYIDWRESRISSEMSSRGEYASFWRSMLDWIKDELIEELITTLILGVFKGVQLAVKGIYKTVKYIKGAKRFKQLGRYGDELGESAAQLMRKVGKPGVSSTQAVPSKANGIPRQIATRKPLDSEQAWNELREELGNDPRGTFQGRQSARVAAEEAVTSRLSGGVAQRGGVDVAVGTHGSAPAIRKGLGVTGATAESAHIGPTSLLKAVEGYNRSSALTIQLPPNIHKTFDDHWKVWAQTLRRSGHTDVSVKEARDEMFRAIKQIPGLDARQKGTMQWLLQKEIDGLGLNLDDKIMLPYPNINPQ